MDRYGSASRVRLVAVMTIGALLLVQLFALRQVSATRMGHILILASLAIAAVGVLMMRPRR